MKNFACFFVIAFALLSVGCKREASTPMEAAERYYGYLIAGDVDHYLQSIHDYDSLPESYRSQLRDMFAQHLDREQQMRGGLAAVRAFKDTLINDSLAHVFVEVTFGDSTVEQESLPLILTSKGWMLK